MTIQSGISLSKRIFDVALTTIGLVLLSPILLIITIMIWSKYGRPIFFIQKRPGYQGKPFYIYKFRTMSNEKDDSGKLLPDGQRITPLGSFLRSYSLDELPELFNVIRGEMSLVGPRPLLMQYLDRYTPRQARRHEVLPGITGWAQIHGRNALTWEDKFEYDIWYVDHWSLLLDIKILMITFWKVIKREGINQPGAATAEEFMGSAAPKDSVSDKNNHND